MSQRIVPPISDFDEVEADEKRCAPATWRTLPRKSQLCILALCRLVDFLQISSLQAYVFYQVQSFDPSLQHSEVSWQASILQGSFTAAQCFTAVLWGRVADAPWCGRKIVLLIGLVGTALSCVGLGFSTSFVQAVVFRTIGGGLNGTVGIIRTMISENIKVKKFQSRAFLILPMSFNLAAFIGPVLGGFLADTTKASPEMRQVQSRRVYNVGYLTSFPYALPNVVNAILLLAAVLIVYFGLEETLQSRRGRFDTGLYIRRRLILTISHFQSLLCREDIQVGDSEECMDPIGSRRISSNSTIGRDLLRVSNDAVALGSRHSDMRLPFYRIWTSNVLAMLVAEALFDFHLGAFSSLLPLFLSAPPLKHEPQDQFNVMHALQYRGLGGLGMPSTTVGIALCFLGAIGLTLQLTIFPVVHSRLGSVQCFQLFCAMFPIGYVAIPFLSLLSSKVLLWAGIISVLSIVVTARTFTLPATIVLLNNCSPHPSVLGAVHAIGQSVSTSFRTIGSIVGGSWYEIGLRNGSSREAWWNVSVVAIFGFLATFSVIEGSSHEIILPEDGCT